MAAILLCVCFFCSLRIEILMSNLPWQRGWWFVKEAGGNLDLVMDGTCARV